MANKKVIFRISGMTCGHCEKTIQNAVKKLYGVNSVTASFPKRMAEVVYNSDKLTEKEIQTAIEKEGYLIKGVSEDGKKQPIGKVAPIFLIVIALYFIAKYTVGFDFINLIPKIDKTVSLIALFFTGLFTSVHCIAMCGGINLSQSVGSAESTQGRFTRPLLYNLGRMVSYTVVGGIVGGIGSVMFVSITLKGVIMLVAAIFMILMSLSMLGWLPWWLVPRLPKKLSMHADKAKKGRGPLIVGLLNGLLPCGPLQAMQLYALSTGSVITGALSMFLFALGTVPLMLGAGLVFSLLKGRFTRGITRVSAVLVMLIAFVMLFNAGGLFGLDLSIDGSPQVAQAGTVEEVSSPNKAGNYYVASVQDGVQVVEAPLERSRYPYILVQKGIPVKFTINAEDKNINGCNYTVVFPSFNIEQELKEGDNMFEFTPEKAGTISYTCWMGMIRGQIKVVDKIDDSAIAESSTEAEGSGGPTIAELDAEKFEVAQIKNGQQEITVTIGEKGFSPALLIVQKDVTIKIKFKADKVDETNTYVIFPEYNGVLDLSNGQYETPELIPEWDFTFISYTGLLPGYVKVVDDINKINIDEIKKEVAQYDFNQNNPFAGGASCH